MACGGIGDFWTCNAVEKENNTTHIPCIIIYYNNKCDCVCINHPYAFSTNVEFSTGAKVVDTLPFCSYLSKNVNPNNFGVESLNKRLKTSAYSVYKLVHLSQIS